jgi:hypothetical protein
MSAVSFSDDDLVKLAGCVLVLAHAGAFAWFWRGRGIAPVLWLNLLVSGAVAAVWLPGLGRLFDYVDAVWLFVAFEYAAFALSLAAVLGGRVPRAAVWTVFAAHAALTAAALVFFFTFKMTRLF